MRETTPKGIGERLMIVHGEWFFEMAATFQLLSFIWAVLVVPLSFVLLIVASTWDGRAFAVAAFCAGIVPLLAASGRAKTRRRRKWVVIPSIILGVVLASILMVKSPKGVGLPDAKVLHIYADGESHFSRFSLSNILPEADQLMLGVTLMAVLDPLLTFGQAKDLRGMTAVIYHDLERDAAFHALGSTMSDVYCDLFGLPFDQGHSYLYVPSTLDRSRPSPVLVFLHGSGGNFKAYLWILSQLADRLKLVLIAPSCGAGNWSPVETERIVQSALKAASRSVLLDEKAIHLAGLSNGGLGVSQLASLQGSRYRSLIFLSPVFDRVSLQAASFARECNGRPILILTGATDDRIPLRYVEENGVVIENVGAQVRLEIVSDATHFMIFSHRERVLTSLENWISGLPSH